MLYEGYEALDAMGPVEVLGGMDAFSVRYVSLHGGPVKSWQGFSVLTQPIAEVPAAQVFLLPGARSIDAQLSDPEFLAAVKSAAEASTYCLTVCTGSALLCRTGLLDGRRATSNKAAFAWVKTLNPAVDWKGRARWTQDGKFFTASGISAGQDMVLGFVAYVLGEEQAAAQATEIEYVWSRDPDADPFAR